MGRPSTSHSERVAVGMGLREGARRVPSGMARRGQAPALLRAPPVHPGDLEALRGWLCGSTALRPAQARRLLEQSLQRHQLVEEPALHWRAVKARIAGEANWGAMGFRLLLD